MSVISVDYETFYSNRLKYTLKKQIAEQYCRDEMFDPYMISVSDGGQEWAGSPKDFNWESLRGQTLLSHNAYFDQTVQAEMQRRGWAPKDLGITAWHCTANLTSYLCNRRSLDQSVEFLFGVKLDKSARADANNKHWPGDFSPVEQATMLNYARSDARWCHRLFAEFGDKWPTWERRLSDLTIRQGQRGVQIDVELLNRYIVETHSALKATEKLIPWIADAEDESWDEFNTKPTSSKCIAEQCRRSGIPCPPVQKEDEEGFLKWEKDHTPRHPWIPCISSWRSLSRIYQSFLKMKERLRSDGTMPFGLKYFGAHTGRWAADAGVNMQNPRKKPIFINEHGLMEIDERKIDAAIKVHAEGSPWPSWVHAVIDFRALILPRPGKKMIVSDLSQIEPRVLAWLTGNTELLAMLGGGMSVYEAHARATMGWAGGNLKKENAGVYALAKARVLGLGYGAGWEKFITMAQDLAGLDITANDPEWLDVPDPFSGEIKKVSGYGTESRRIVAEFREQNQKIVSLWGTLDAGLRSSISGTYTVHLPSGRKIEYRNVRCEARIEPNKVTGKPQRRSVFTADTDGRRRIYYGGMMTENVVQAVARDVFGEHLVRLEDAGLTSLFSAHDEAVMEVDKSVEARDIEHEMSHCPEWLPGCPIGAEAKEVAHYCK